MEDKDLTDYDEMLESLLDVFDEQVVEGGVDPAEEDDNCVGGACKI